MSGQPHTPLAAVMAAQGIGTGVLALRAGITPGAVRHWKRGQSIPQPPTARRVAETLGVAVADLWPELGLVSPDARLLSVAEVLDRPACPDPDPHWRKRAACANGQHDPDEWWPEAESDPAFCARLICSTCPVLTQCRDAFLANSWSDRSCIIAGVKGSTLILRARQRRRSKQKPAAKAA
jgi:transcriptional regulator with XRE-family HTH domain